MRKDPCFWCGNAADTWDHIVPVSQRGRKVEENLTRACSKCNSNKGSLSLLQFLIKYKKNGKYRKMFPISRYERLKNRRERRLARALDNVQ